jgi:hypothetical protein
MDYRFDIHHYGPFSDQIVRDTRTLILEDVLIDRSNEPAAFSDYSIGPKARHLIDSHADIPAGVRKLVQEVMDALVSLPPKRLELLSTVHYAFRMLMAGGGAPSKEAVVNQFYEFKEPERFSSIEVVDAFELLMRVGVIRA